MRIIAGKIKGLELSEAGGMAHPMGERVRNSLFNSLGEKILAAKVVDVCAGTGAVGLEAISRGAAEVILIEKEPKMQEILRKNVKKAEEGLVRQEPDLRGRLQVWAGLAEKVLTKIDECDIIIVDAPYAQYENGEFLAKIGKISEKILKKAGVLVVSAPKALEVEGFDLVKLKKHAGAVLNFFEKI